jgi:hypothetical protein
VQKELKLSDEQIKKVGEVTQDVRAKHKEDYAKLRDAEPAERFQKMREINQTVVAEIEKGMQSDLKPEQQKRLAQIKLQQKGVRAFEDADVQKALNLTADQKDTLKTINEDLQKDQRELFGGGRGAGAGAGGGRRGGGRGQFNPETFKKMAAVQKEAMDKAVATLNDNQKKQWKEMTGEPFTMTPAFGGGRRGNRQ